MAIISSVDRTSPKVWMKLTSVAMCSSSVRSACASDTMTALQSCMAASRADDSQHTLVSVPTMTAVSIPSARSSLVSSLALGRKRAVAVLGNEQIGRVGLHLGPQRVAFAAGLDLLEGPLRH